MKRICIVIPEGLPVPAVRGGAIETLIQQVIDINELEKKSYFTIICSEDQNAVKLSQEYKYTDFFFIPYKEKSKIQHLKELACRVIKKIAHIEAYSKPRYMKIVENYILDNQSKFDYVINESYSLLGMKRISDILGKKRMVAHLHCYVKATEKLESIYGTIVTVSDYIKKKWLETAKNTSTKVIVVKNGINQKKFQCEVSQNQINEIQKQLDIREDDFVVLYCGRIVPQKGVKELIEAILRINNKK